MTAETPAAPAPEANTDTVDLDAVHAKYIEERDKRIRPDGNEQYLEPTGKFASLLVDPYTEVVEREPVHDHVTFAIIGGGFAGLVTGARLHEVQISARRFCRLQSQAGLSSPVP